MDRALLNVLKVADSVQTHNEGSGYELLDNIQLAAEVQKFNGYNHFSRSASHLLEEVVNRLVETGVASTPETITEQSPISFGSMITYGDLNRAKVKIRLDLSTAGRNTFPMRVKQALMDYPEIDAAEFFDKLKKKYTFGHWFRAPQRKTHFLVIYSLKMNNPMFMDNSEVLHWHWELKDGAKTQ